MHDGGMNKEAASLQFDLFSGELVDNRTRTQKRRDKQREQPQQSELFAQSELAQFGISAHPRMSYNAATPLELSLQDVRTDEEKERDLQRAAEAATFHLFENDTPIQPVDGMIDADNQDDDDEPAYFRPDSLPKMDKMTAYLGLVNVAQEHSSTTWIDPQYSGAFLAEIGLAMTAAREAGLMEEEITAALQVGEYRGSHHPA